MPIPVAERSKARVCGRSVAGVAGSNPAGGHGRFVELHIKERRHSQDKEVVQMKYREQKNKTRNPAEGMDVCLL